MKKFLGFALLWVACGTIAWGQTMGWFTQHFPEFDQRSVAAFMAIAGPVGLVVSSIEDVPYNFRMRPLSLEERWELWHKRWPDLSRADFDRETP